MSPFIFHTFDVPLVPQNGVLHHRNHVVGMNITLNFSRVYLAARRRPTLTMDKLVVENNSDPEKGLRIKWNPNTSERGHGTNSKSIDNSRSYGHRWSRRGSSTGLPHKHLQSMEHERIREAASSWAQLSPLMAATFGPLAVLLGIPCLTQRWHGTVLDPPLLPNGWSNFEALPDPPLNITLSGVTLFCEIMGNAFLILRFSDFHVKVTTWLSYAFWSLKIIVGLGNYIQFGIAHPQTDDIIYLEGYWVMYSNFVLNIGRCL